MKKYNSVWDAIYEDRPRKAKEMKKRGLVLVNKSSSQKKVSRTRS